MPLPLPALSLPSRFRAALLSLALLLPVAAQALNGQLDLCFGDNAFTPGCGRTGKTFLYWPEEDPAANPSAFLRGHDWAIKVLATRDGGAITVSRIGVPYNVPYSGPQMIGISKHRRDGTADTTFGDPDPFIAGARTGRTTLYVNQDSDWLAGDAALDAAGDLFVAGTVWTYPSGRSDIAVWKLNANGTWASGFASNGLLLAARPGLTFDEGRSVNHLGAESPWMAGAGTVRDNGSVGDIGMLLFDRVTGQLCPHALQECGNTTISNPGVSGTWRMFRSGAFLCNGTPVSIQLIDSAIGRLIENSLDDWRLPIGFAFNYPCNGNAAGVAGSQIFRNGVNAGWILTGTATHRFDGQLAGLTDANVDAIVFDPADGGRWLVAGRVFNNSGGAHAGLSRHLLHAGADTSFGGTGRIHFDMRNQFTPTNAGQAHLNDVVIQPDGRIVVAGGFNPSTWSFGDALLARLNRDGSFDASFGNYSVLSPGRMGYGHSINGIDRDNRFTTLALTPDAQLLVAGYAYATSDTGYHYTSLMRVLAVDDRIFYSGFE